MIELLKMNETEFAVFKEYSVADYAEDLMKEKDITREQALFDASKEFDAGLPEGPDTKNSFVMNIQDESGKILGRIWYEYETDEEGNLSVFLCDLLIFEQERRKGHASSAIFQMNRLAKADGCLYSSLFVWNHNPAGMSLYEKCGYRPGAGGEGGIFMIKKL